MVRKLDGLDRNLRAIAGATVGSEKHLKYIREVYGRVQTFTPLGFALRVLVIDPVPLGNEGSVVKETGKVILQTDPGNEGKLFKETGGENDLVSPFQPIVRNMVCRVPAPPLKPDTPEES